MKVPTLRGHRECPWGGDAAGQRDVLAAAGDVPLPLGEDQILGEPVSVDDSVVTEPLEVRSLKDLGADRR